MIQETLNNNQLTESNSMTNTQTQLIQTTKPVADIFKETLPKAGRDLVFVSHANVTQILLATVGTFNFEPVAGSAMFDAEGNLEAEKWRLTAVVDGQEVSVVSTGDFDGPKGKGQGFRSQVIEGNALRRCAMRGFGIALELWVDGGEQSGKYIVHDYLKSRAEETAEA